MQQQLLSRLNRLALATGVTPDDLLETIMETMERSLFSTPADISTADRTPTRRVKRSGWSPAQRAAHSVRMKEAYRKKMEAQQPKRRGPKQITPEHRAKLQAGLARYRIQQKMQANA